MKQKFLEKTKSISILGRSMVAKDLLLSASKYTLQREAPSFFLYYFGHQKKLWALVLKGVNCSWRLTLSRSVQLLAKKGIGINKKILNSNVEKGFQRLIEKLINCFLNVFFV